VNKELLIGDGLIIGSCCCVPFYYVYSGIKGIKDCISNNICCCACSPFSLKQRIKSCFKIKNKKNRDSLRSIQFKIEETEKKSIDKNQW
jgi:hypothetical protein